MAGEQVPAVEQDQYTLFDDAAEYPFSIGAPEQGFLLEAAKLMKQAADSRLTREIEVNNGRLMQYGARYGDADFLKALEKFLREQYEDLNVSRKNLAQTAGATTALTILLNHMFPNGTTVYFEHLCYFLAVDIFTAHNFVCKGVETDADGINLKDLEEILKKDANSNKITQDRGNKVYSSLIYMVPIYQNPLGTVLSEEKSQGLIELARKYNCLIFCDDVYNLFTYDGVKHRRLFSYDLPTDEHYGLGHVVSNGTFSKILSPALRLGWMELPKFIRDKYFFKSGSLNTFTGGLVTELLNSGQVSTQVEVIRQEQAKKMEILLKALDDYLPEGCSIIHRPKGGYFVQVSLPERIACGKVSNIMKEKGVTVHPGKKFVPERREYTHLHYNNSIRLCIAYIPAGKIRPGVELMCSVIASYNGITAQEELEEDAERERLEKAKRFQ